MFHPVSMFMPFVPCAGAVLLLTSVLLWYSEIITKFNFKISNKVKKKDGKIRKTKKYSFKYVG